jgi:hypothetical protein
MELPVSPTGLSLGRGIALTGGLKASGNSGGVECLQRGAFAEHLDFFYCDFRLEKLVIPSS